MEGQQKVILMLVLACAPALVSTQTVDIYNLGLNSRIDDVNIQCTNQNSGACSNQYGDIIAAASKATRCPALDKFVSCAKSQCQQLLAFSSTYDDVDAYCGASTSKASLATIAILSFVVMALVLHR